MIKADEDQKMEGEEKVVSSAFLELREELSNVGSFKHSMTQQGSREGASVTNLVPDSEAWKDSFII